MTAGNSFSELASRLTGALDLRQPPVAIGFSNSIPPSLANHRGRVPAGCRFWEDAAGSAFSTSAADHNLCAIGVYTHHLQESPAQQADLMDALRVFGELGYVTAQDLAAIPVLESRHEYVLYSPLSGAQFVPDVVLLFVQANQSLILSEATQQVESRNPPAMGMPACAVVPQVMNSGRAALSLGCCGARAYLDVFTDEVALFAGPAQSWRRTQKESRCSPRRTRFFRPFIRVAVAMWRMEKLPLSSSRCWQWERNASRKTGSQAQAAIANRDGLLNGLAEARVSRTHRRPLRTTTGFEDREDHRSLSASRAHFGRLFAESLCYLKMK